MNNKILITIALAVFFIAVIFLFSFFYSAPKQASVCFNPPAGGCFKVEIAKTSLELSKGLTLRKSLEQNKGMLFIFDKPDLYSIWMPNMKFYLDVIWFDSEGHVVHIEENIRPCQTALEIQTCPDISPNGNSLYILEVTSGFVDKFNITKDSKFSWVSDNPSYGQ